MESKVLVVYGPKDNKNDIIDNFNRFDVSVCKSLVFFMHLKGAITVSSIKSGKISSGPLS